MSLINDALKRAKAAQQPTPPAAPHSLEFKAVEPAQQTRQHTSLFLPALVVVAAAGVAVGVLWPRKLGPANPAVPKVQTALPANSATAIPVSATPVAPEHLPAVAKPAPALVVTDPAQHGNLVASAPVVVSNKSVEIPEMAATSSPPVFAEPAPPKPPPLKLQAILLNATHPSAMISGKTLFIGDRIGELKLVAIKQESATLVGAGQTNILNLPQ